MKTILSAFCALLLFSCKKDTITETTSRPIYQSKQGVEFLQSIGADVSNKDTVTTYQVKKGERVNAVEFTSLEQARKMVTDMYKFNSTTFKATKATTKFKGLKDVGDNMGDTPVDDGTTTDDDGHRLLDVTVQTIISMPTFDGGGGFMGGGYGGIDDGYGGYGDYFNPNGTVRNDMYHVEMVTSKTMFSRLNVDFTFGKVGNEINAGNFHVQYSGFGQNVVFKMSTVTVNYYNGTINYVIIGYDDYNFLLDGIGTIWTIKTQITGTYNTNSPSESTIAKTFIH